MRKKWLIFIAKNNIFSSNDELKNRSCTADQEFTWISVHQKMQKIISSVHPSRSAYNLNHSLKYSTVIVSFKPSSNARVSIHGRLKLPHYCYLETLPWKNCEQDSHLLNQPRALPSIATITAWTFPAQFSPFPSPRYSRDPFLSIPIYFQINSNQLLLSPCIIEYKYLFC